MGSIAANTRQVEWNDGRGHGGSFTPNGPRHFHGDRDTLMYQPNAKTWKSRGGFAARIFMAFERDGRKTGTMNKLVALVKRVRGEQTRKAKAPRTDPGTPDASFIAQRGIYRHRDGARRVVDEPGAQIVIIDMSGAIRKERDQQMRCLATEICHAFDQDEVVLEIQRRGLTIEVYGVDQPGFEDCP